MRELWLTLFMGSFGYLVGAIPFSYLVARWKKGVDLRQSGTQNVGAYNVLKVLGAPFAVLATAGDVSKGIVVVTVAEALDVSTGVLYLAMLAVVAGHIWPVFLAFKGGTGVATTIGAAGALVPYPTLAAGGVGLLVGLPSKSPPVGIFAGLVTLNVVVLLARPMGDFGAVLLLSLLVAFAHLLKKYRQVKSGMKKASWKEIF
jgi:glycerol-3-phosphate acyltransferase PlsY